MKNYETWQQDAEVADLHDALAKRDIERAFGRNGFIDSEEITVAINK